MTTTCTPVGAGAAIALRLTTLLDRLADCALLPDALHHHAISEAWFSDHFAWLLDPRAPASSSTSTSRCSAMRRCARPR